MVPEYLEMFYTTARDILRAIETTQTFAIREAGAGIAEKLAGGGIWAVYDTGHMLRHEAHFRAGGLAALLPFHFSVTAEPSADLRPKTRVAAPARLSVERDKAAWAFDETGLDARDALLINSNSGRSRAVIETAREAQARGVFTIGVSSRAQIEATPAEDQAGTRLPQVVHIFIDNCTPAGDAVLPTRSGEKMCPMSGIASAFILWAIQAHVVACLEEKGLTPTLYRSVHLGGMDYFEQQQRRYRELGV